MAHIRCDFRSEVLDMGTSMSVVIPESIKGKDTKVVYLLHGLADNCTGWLRYTSVERYAREYNVALVIPEVQRSFYSDMVYGLDYFTFIHSELPKLCSNMFNFSSKREQTYIMGLSMGGYAALKCMFTSPRRYAGCAAFSAANDIALNIKEENGGRKSEYIGIFGNELKVPNSCNLMKMVRKADISNLPPIYMACGTEDGFFNQNKEFYSILKDKKADITFESWDGNHNWIFWDEAVKRALRYFFANK